MCKISLLILGLVRRVGRGAGGVLHLTGLFTMKASKVKMIAMLSAKCVCMCVFPLKLV